MIKYILLYSIKLFKIKLQCGFTLIFITFPDCYLVVIKKKKKKKITIFVLFSFIKIFNGFNIFINDIFNKRLHTKNDK